MLYNYTGFILLDLGFRVTVVGNLYRFFCMHMKHQEFCYVFYIWSTVSVFRIFVNGKLKFYGSYGLKSLKPFLERALGAVYVPILHGLG